MNIVYVSRLLTWDGLEHVGRTLLRHLSAEHNVKLCGAIVSHESPLLRGHLAQQVMPSSELIAADVVYMEGGWNRSDGSPDRFPQELADDFVRRGGQLIVADLDRNVAKDDAAVLERSRALLGTVPSPNERGVQYLRDEGALDVGSAHRFVPAQMRIDDSLKRTWDGIDSVLVHGAVVLPPPGNIVASGHADTSVLVNDVPHARGGYWPWAMMKHHGVGHVVVIGALLSDDSLVEACPDNARWVSNLMTLLVDRTAENSMWQGNRLTRGADESDPARLYDTRKPVSGLADGSDSSYARQTPADVAEELRRVIKGGESRTVEFKSTGRKNRHTGHKDPAVELSILKSVAGFMNTDGGTLLVGVADDGGIVGIEEDFPFQGKPSIDGWELWLTDLMSFSLGQAAAMEVTVTYGEIGGATIAKIDVGPSARPVFVTPTKGEKRPVFLARMNSSTRELLGSEAVDYQRKRWPAS